MPATESLFTSGEVAERLRLPRWRLLYLVERGVIPGPSFHVPGRRLFTEADVRLIEAALADRPTPRGEAPPHVDGQAAGDV